MRVSFLDLPTELIDMVLDFLDPDDAARSICCTRLFNDLQAHKQKSGDPVFFMKSDDVIGFDCDKGLIEEVVRQIQEDDLNLDATQTRDIKILHSRSECCITFTRWLDVDIGDDDDDEIDIVANDFAILKLASEDGTSFLRIWFDMTGAGPSVSIRVTKDKDEPKHFPLLIFSLFLSLGVLYGLREYDTSAVLKGLSDNGIKVPNWLMRYVRTWDLRSHTVKKVLYDELSLVL